MVTAQPILQDGVDIILVPHGALSPELLTEMGLTPAFVVTGPAILRTEWRTVEEDLWVEPRTEKRFVIVTEWKEQQ